LSFCGRGEPRPSPVFVCSLRRESYSLPTFKKEIIVRITQGVVAGAVASAFMCCLLFSSAAAQAAGSSIVVMNLRKVVSSSEAGKVAQKELEHKLKELQDRFKPDEEALSALQDEIEKKSSAWSEEKKQEKGLEFRKKQRDLRVKQDDAQMELKKLEEQHLTPIRKALEKVIDKLAKEKGYNIILPSEVVMFADDTVDITDEVTKAFNASAKK
jgi:outer membrane protein